MVESWQFKRATFTRKRISLFHENCSRQIRTPCHKPPGKGLVKGKIDGVAPWRGSVTTGVLNLGSTEYC